MGLLTVGGFRVPPAVAAAGGVAERGRRARRPDGFVSVEEAARRMVTTTDHVRRLAEMGALRSLGTDEQLLVRAARVIGAVPAPPPPPPPDEEPPGQSASRAIAQDDAEPEASAPEAAPPRRRRRRSPRAALERAPEG